MLPNRWLIQPRPQPAARLRLFCLPYAGGGASLYYPWATALPATVEVIAVQLPGRQNRFAEAAFTDWAALLVALDSALLPGDDQPYAVFGYSLGAILAFEWVRRRRRQGQSLPRHLFVAGHRAPQEPGTYPPLHALPDGEFLAGIMQLNGTPPQVAQHAELLELLLPTLRADFTLAETYHYVPEMPLACPITAFGGVDDGQIPATSITAWAAQTTGVFRAEMIAGDHFFIHSAPATLTTAIVADLAL